MENIEVKNVTPNELEQLQQIGRQTFLETFSKGNTEENMKKYLEESFSMEKLSIELNNESSVFYFALRNNKVIGYLKLNYGQSQTELQEIKRLKLNVSMYYRNSTVKKSDKYFMKRLCKSQDR